MASPVQSVLARSVPKEGVTAASVVRQLAHELRQPLSTIESIACYLEMLLPHADVCVREQLGKLQQMVGEANWIVSDAVHLCQASPPNPELLDLNETVSRCVSEWTLKEQGHVSLVLDNALPLVRLDPSQAEHLVRSLLHNVVARVAGEGCEIRTCASGDSACLAIRLGAPRCSGEELRALLEPGATGSEARFALSLASLHRIAEVHRGTLEIQPGSGNDLCLAVSFPAAV